MASMAASIRNICKLNRIRWTSNNVNKQVKINESFDRTIGTTTVHKFKTFPGYRNKACEGTRKNWVSFGFSNQDEYLDKHMMHITFFVTVSICATLGGYIIMYLPDFRMKDWALREAYLELRRRENEGLPPIDPNLIDPSKVILPSDEELGDTKIII